VLCLVGLLALSACTGDSSTKAKAAPRSAQTPQNAETGPQPKRPKPTVVISGLAGPTQIAFGPSGTWLVAELGGDDPTGDENGSTGQVLLIDPASKAQRVLADGLDKPTGVAWINGVVWVMVRRGVLRFALPEVPLSSLMAASSMTAMPEVSVVLADLPFNGRSEGTLTPRADGTFLYETTGNIVGKFASGNSEPEAGSGTLWSFDPRTNASTPVAIGLKNSYAHVVLSDGRIATTEIGDNISLEPLDEVNVLETTAGKRGNVKPQSFGWPVCDAAGQPLAKADGLTCSTASPALRTFPAHLTPTGIAQHNNDLYVSLFVSGQIMRLPNDAAAPSNQPINKRAPVEEFASGIEGPHTLLVDGARLLVTETTAGRIITFDLPK
jgi:glucose/arabinose dehydrogenase